MNQRDLKVLWGLPFWFCNLTNLILLIICKFYVMQFFCRNLLQDVKEIELNSLFAYVKLDCLSLNVPTFNSWWRKIGSIDLWENPYSSFAVKFMVIFPHKVSFRIMDTVCRRSTLIMSLLSSCPEWTLFILLEIYFFL